MMSFYIDVLETRETKAIPVGLLVSTSGEEENGKIVWSATVKDADGSREIIRVEHSSQKNPTVEDVRLTWGRYSMVLTSKEDIVKSIIVELHKPLR
ncbi:MAG TPA: hypothetical protein VK508_18210 [Cyclobacteriaceae bacterium]|nr:hypothetical protein [Cyclobacteriaceae bacterium]